MTKERLLERKKELEQKMKLKAEEVQKTFDQRKQFGEKAQAQLNMLNQRYQKANGELAELDVRLKEIRELLGNENSSQVKKKKGK